MAVLFDLAYIGVRGYKYNIFFSTILCITTGEVVMYRKKVGAIILIQAAWDVLKSNKYMMIFPLLSLISVVLILCSFTQSFTQMMNFSEPTSILEYAKLWLFYFINYFIITFFNVGLTCCALRRMKNESASFKDGILEACKKVHQILGWSLFFASVALIIRIIEDKSSWVADFIMNILESAFTLASYLMIPVMVAENKNPFAALKGSAELFKKTWGNQIKGEIGMGLYFILFAAPAILLFVIGITTFGDSPSIMSIFITLGVAYLLILWVAQAALDTVYRGALYVYSKTGEVPEGFEATINRVEPSESDPIDFY
ncbi:DUF6159 family protein [Legionella waltersii]|uniref:Transmembrane protein n=1 Tax=Legionella waltersii TaxID=66969 RepID=A0A0W1AKB2_9GAMM|nr:DUF6159 family protein [Legionella waltersii]KTD81767.1 hypothetical protein Lwal_1019 [Legionella waltersii]SNU97196.1 Uncharacterised protein [Legionella waltersii]